MYYVRPECYLTTTSVLVAFNLIFYLYLFFFSLEEVVSLGRDHLTDLSPKAISVLAGKGFGLIIGYRWKRGNAKVDSLAVTVHPCTALLSLQLLLKKNTLLENER